MSLSLEEISESDDNLENDDELTFEDLSAQRATRKEDPEDIPLSNKETIPLLPNANRKEAKEAVAMKVHKLNQPNPGYKGEIHISADEEYIASMFGDGIYTVEFINSRKKVIKKREGIRIAVGMSNESPRDNDPENKGNLSALHLAHISHNLERKRSAAQSEEMVKTARELAKQHTDMVTESAKSSATRDREFYSGQATSTQSFFASILQQQQQMAETARQNSEQAHRQQMEAGERAHERMIMMLEMMHQRNSESNNPMLMLTLFKQGMDMGRDMGGDDSEPWERAIKTGVDGLKSLSTMQQMSLMGKKLQAGANPRQLPRPIANPTKPQSTQQPSKESQVSTSPAFDANELKEIEGLKAICDKRGIDFDTIIREAKEFLDKASEEELDEQSNDSDIENKPSESGVD